MRVRVLTSFGGAWEGRLFFGEEGQALDLPDELAQMLIKAGQVEPVKQPRPTPARKKTKKG